MGLIDQQAEIFVVELATHHVRARRQHATTHHDLDDVHPPLDPLRDGCTQCCLAAPDLTPEVPAVTADAGDRRPGRHDGRHRAGIWGGYLVPACYHRPAAV